MTNVDDARPYHRGNLREALLDAVDGIVRESGVEGVTVRGCARRVGVSHTAAFRHFADKRALLTAFAARSARRMARRIDAEVATATGEGDRLLLAGLGYVRFAVEEPGAFRAVFREEILDADDPDYRAATAEMEARLASGPIATTSEGHIAPEALLAWAAAHGLAALYVDGSLSRDLPEGRHVEAMKEALALLSQVFRPVV